MTAYSPSTHFNETATESNESLSAIMRSIGDLVLHHRSEIAESGSYPNEIIDTMRSAGLLRMTLAQAFGGGGRDSAYVLDVLERVACIDASLAWNLMAWSQAKITSARLPSATFDEVVSADPDVLLCTSSASTGTVKPDGDALLVDGEWPFASGSDRCTWLVVHVDDTSADEVAKKGLLLHRDEVTFIDTWDTLGLRETASRTVAVSNVRVERSRLYELDHISERNSTPHSRFPVRPSFAMHMAAIALGNARSAVMDVVAELQKREDRQNANLAESIGVVSSELKLSMNGLYSLAETSWQTVFAGGKIDDGTAATMAGVSSSIVRKCVDTVLSCYFQIGTRAIFDSHPMQKRLRDALTIAQHANVSLRNCAQLGTAELSGGMTRANVLGSHE